ncbi:hypothetical protein [Lactonifactor longoviformis]|uniref:hypothetical protein n=1 Tax=Lactonifactor longoviformis TaxID=341220 RepID=UPI0009347131|nr:hypothetical protein [Lactonifactor longoviformis]
MQKKDQKGKEGTDGESDAGAEGKTGAWEDRRVLGKTLQSFTVSKAKAASPAEHRSHSPGMPEMHSRPVIHFFSAWTAEKISSGDTAFA